MLAAILLVLGQCPSPTGELRLATIEACPALVRVQITGCAPDDATYVQGSIVHGPELQFAGVIFYCCAFPVPAYDLYTPGESRFDFGRHRPSPAPGGEFALGEIQFTPLAGTTGDVYWQPLPPAITSTGFQFFPSCVEYCCDIVNAPSVPVVPCGPGPEDVPPFVAALLAGEKAADYNGDGFADGRDVSAFVEAIL